MDSIYHPIDMYLSQSPPENEPESKKNEQSYNYHVVEYVIYVRNKCIMLCNRSTTTAQHLEIFLLLPLHV